MKTNKIKREVSESFNILKNIKLDPSLKLNQIYDKLINIEKYLNEK